MELKAISIGRDGHVCRAKPIDPTKFMGLMWHECFNVSPVIASVTVRCTDGSSVVITKELT